MLSASTFSTTIVIPSISPENQLDLRGELKQYHPPPILLWWFWWHRRGFRWKCNTFAWVLLNRSIIKKRTDAHKLVFILLIIHWLVLSPTSIKPISESLLISFKKRCPAWTLWLFTHWRSPRWRPMWRSDPGGGPPRASKPQTCWWIIMLINITDGWSTASLMRGKIIELLAARSGNDACVSLSEGTPAHLSSTAWILQFNPDLCVPPPTYVKWHFYWMGCKHRHLQADVATPPTINWIH